MSCLSCKIYSKSLSAENLHSAFRRSGIYPLDSTAINKDNLIPAEVFCGDDSCERNVNNTDLNRASNITDVVNKNDNVSVQAIEVTCG